MSYENEYVWSPLLRLYHWFFAGSFVALVVTGFYINAPWSHTMLEGSRSFPMAEMRYIHFLAAYIFSGSLAARIYLLFFGNKNERIADLAPVTPRNIKHIFSETAHYLHLTDYEEHRSGHNALGGATFIIIFILALVQIISGFFMLYPENTFWQTWGLRIVGPQQNARYVHHLVMWAFIIFSAIHIYMVVWNDIRTKNGLASSMLNGVKFFKKTKS
jgi:Ni/Fe-hydrogenase 1 B-type cytochrome subunit